MSKPKKTLRNRFLYQIFVPASFSIALLMIGFILVNPAVKKLLVNERRQMVGEMVGSIYNLMDGYNDKVLKGEMTLSQAQEIVMTNIKCQHYGKNQVNYFWIQTYDSKILYHPAIGSLIPVNPKISDIIYDIAERITELVKKQNDGFLTYKWYASQLNSGISVKQSYAKGFKPWGWIIGSGFLLSDIEDDLNQLTNKVMRTLFSILIAMLLILTFVLFRNYKNLQKILLHDMELKKSEERFRGFAEHIDYGLMIFEYEKPVFATDQFGMIFNINKHEIVNFNLLDFLPGWERERVKLILNEHLHQDSMEFSTWLRLKNNSEKYVNFHFSFDIDSDKANKYLVVQDLTEQKQTLTTIDILSENLAKSPTAILITDLNGNIEYVNPGFEISSGYSFDEVRDKNPRIIKSEKMSPMVYEDLWKTISSGEIWRGDLLNRKKDGSLYWESTIIFPIKNRHNETIKYSSIKTDITQKKRIEQELLAARDKAEENERFKTAFLNNVSHEVRTPLNAINGFSMLLKDELASNDTALEYLKIIEQNCQILLKLFEDILDVSAIESRSITLRKEDIALKALLLKIISKYNTQLTVSDVKPIEIVIEQDDNFDTMVLHTDRKRITQIFDKLLSNAVKFTNEGKIKISYIIYPENITFHISDTGVGIPDKEKDLIFSSFSHGSHMFVGLHKGVGMGLNIAKLLIELLGGLLTFTTREGQGTTFSFTFPTLELKNYTLHGPPLTMFTHNVSSKKILIAEDNDENFKFFEAVLSPQNTIIWAKTGQEAVDLIEKGNELPDIILMDILMPVMDGISASRLIRKIYPSIPIVAVTAIGMELTGPEMMIFNALVNKPVSAPLLMDKIYNVFASL